MVQVMYTGSQVWTDSAAAESLRALWTFEPVACPYTAIMEGEIGDEEDDEDFGSLRGRLSMQRERSSATSMMSSPCSGGGPLFISGPGR
jgi:hypothetical protein